MSLTVGWFVVFLKVSQGLGVFWKNTICKVPFSSHHIWGTGHQRDLSPMIFPLFTLFTWPRQHCQAFPLLFIHSILYSSEASHRVQPMVQGHGGGRGGGTMYINYLEFFCTENVCLLHLFICSIMFYFYYV